MGNPFFRFKQFTVFHDRCAMKVGMDGSLLGAWAGDSQKPDRILDIGTGTGLISLMCAQRFPSAQIRGIDINSGCLEQALENIERSPWGDRITVSESRLQDYSDDPFDLIVCNPPFFNRSSQSGQTDRNQARHDDHLSFEELVGHSARLINPKGIIALILPEERVAELLGLSEKQGLHLVRSVKVRGTVSGPVRRRLLELSPSLPSTEPVSEELAVEAGVKEWTPEYAALLKEFYLAL